MPMGVLGNLSAGDFACPFIVLSSNMLAFWVALQMFSQLLFFYGDSVKLMVALFHQKLPLFTPISRAYYPWIITLVALLFLTAQDCNDVME